MAENSRLLCVVQLSGMGKTLDWHFTPMRVEGGGN